MDKLDAYNHTMHPANMVMQWFSRFTATFLGTTLALILFVLLMRFYFEMTVGKAIGDMREKQEQKLKTVSKTK